MAATKREDGQPTLAALKEEETQGRAAKDGRNKTKSTPPFGEGWIIIGGGIT